MATAWKLTIEGRTVPVAGEYMGSALEAAAKKAAEAPHLRPTAAGLYKLAADAFSIAAGVTLGHKRAEGYCDAARECMKRSRELLEELEELES